MLLIVEAANSGHVIEYTELIGIPKVVVVVVPSGRGPAYSGPIH